MTRQRNRGRIYPDFHGTRRRLGRASGESFRVSGMGGGEHTGWRGNALLGQPVVVRADSPNRAKGPCLRRVQASAKRLAMPFCTQPAGTRRPGHRSGPTPALLSTSARAALAGGVAPYTVLRMPVLSGGAVAAGTSAATVLFLVTPSGGLSLDGTAATTWRLLHTPTGGLLANGTAPAATAKVYQHIPSGGAVTAGAAPTLVLWMPTPERGRRRRRRRGPRCPPLPLVSGGALAGDAG
jgi:hypothetical protein